MANESEFLSASGERNRRESSEAQWGAEEALRRSVGLDKKPDEAEPLLGSERGSSTEQEERDAEDKAPEPEWEGYAEFAGLTWWRTPSVTWLLPPFFLFALAVGGIVVPKLGIILSLVCRDYLVEKAASDPSYIFAPVLLGEDNPQCRDAKIQALTSKFILSITTITGILGAIMSPKIGSLSDRYGRIKLMVVTSMGALLAEIITILAVSFPDVVHYKWLLLGGVFDGLCGSFIAGMALTHAYAADCTAPPKRAVAFGYFHACLFSGIAVGPLLAAVLVRLTNSLIVIFYTALGVHTFFILFVLLAVPESLSKKRQQLAREKLAARNEELAQQGSAWPINWNLTARNNGSAQERGSWLRVLKQANILEPLKVLWPTGPGSSTHLRVNLILLATVDTIIFGVAMGAMAVVILYCGFQFGWDAAETSVFVSVVNICRVAGLVIILPSLNYIFRTRRANKQRRESGVSIALPNSGSDTLDLTTIRFAVLLETAGYFVYAIARTPATFVLGGMLAAFGGIGSPTLQSALTKHVPHDSVGSLLGATAMLHSLSRIVCPAVFGLIYASTVGNFRQAIFVVLSACFGAGFLFSWFLRPNVYLVDNRAPQSNAARELTEANADVLVDEEIVGA